MDTVLIAVTLISLAMALAMGVLVARLLREERRRSDARVAALIEMSAGVPAAQAPAPAAAPRSTPRPAAAAPAPPVSISKPRPIPAPARVRLETASPVAVIDSYDMIRPSQPAAPAAAIGGDLFIEPEASSPWGRRFAVIGALAIVAGSALFAATIRRGSSAETATPSTVTRSDAAASAPLELVSLRHTHEGEVLTITGLVQNPSSALPVSHIVATAVVFAPDGTFLTSGRAALDYTSLAAGDESPFVMTIPVKGQVARYRVGFRNKDGGVVAHVDRRNAEGVARR